MSRLVLSALVVLLASADARAQASSPTCRRDDELTELAAAVASFARDHDGRAPDSSSLARALRASGSGIPSVRANVTRGDGAASQIAVSARDRCGTAEAGTDGARFRAQLYARAEADWAVLERPDGALEVYIDVAAGLSAAEAFALDARGRTRRVDARRSGGRTVVRISAGELPLRLQVSASDDRGPRPVVTLDLPRRERDVQALLALLELPSPARAAPRVVDRLIAARTEAGARSVRPNRLLSRLGHAHARAMCEADRVAHVVDREAGDLERRAAREGLFARSLGEAVARSDDSTSAIGAVMSSPSHRALLLDRRWTDLGAGTAIDARGRTCLVVVLAAWPRLR